MDQSKQINLNKSQTLTSSKGDISRDGRKTEQSFIMKGSGPQVNYADPSSLTCHKPKTGKFKFDKSARFQNPKPSPGPGYYNA